MKTDPNDEAPKRTRTTKTPAEAALGNIDSAINSLESLGSRLFKLGRTDLIQELGLHLASLRTLKANLTGPVKSEPAHSDAAPAPPSMPSGMPISRPKAAAGK